MWTWVANTSFVARVATSAIHKISRIYCKVSLLKYVSRHDGWVGIDDAIGNYGTKYVQRAGLASVGYGAHLPEDAMYRFFANMLKGGVHGEEPRVIHLPSAPPVNSFWSIHVYEDDYLAR